MKDFTSTDQTYLPDSWHKSYFIIKGQVSTLRRLVPEDNFLPLSQSKWVNAAKCYPKFSKNLCLNARTPSPTHSHVPKWCEPGCASSPTHCRPEWNFPCHFTTTVLYKHAFPDEIQVAFSLCNKNMQFLVPFWLFLKTYYTESMYSMFKDKLQNCILNQYE
jgi:hypothetical protein